MGNGDGHNFISRTLSCERSCFWKHVMFSVKHITLIVHKVIMYRTRYKIKLRVTTLESSIIKFLDALLLETQYS